MFYVKIHALMFYMVVHHHIKCISKYYPNLKKKCVYCGTISFQRLKVTKKMNIQMINRKNFLSYKHVNACMKTFRIACGPKGK